MPMTVWKYVLAEVKLRENFTCLRVPAGAKVLKIERQRNKAVIYMLVNPQKPLVDQWIYGAGTGDLIPSGVKVGVENYLGTAILTDPDRHEPDGENSVWHYWLLDFELVAIDNVIRVPSDYWGSKTVEPSFGIWQAEAALV